MLEGKSNGDAQNSRHGLPVYPNLLAELALTAPGLIHHSNREVVLTSFPEGDKLGRGSPKGGHYAKGTANLYQGIQAGISAMSSAERKIAGASGTRPGHCR